MDKSERETHDFMNVESFSQLPFIRPAPVKEKNGGIRLFGKEFGANDGVAAATDESESAETTNEDSSTLKESSDNGSENNRRFECHYCCRNFPTSQALGGHQNAHKRERQHAKRAHLQSAMVHGTLSDAHIYGLVNYRIGTSPSSSLSTYNHHHPSSSWSSQFPMSGTSSSNSRFYSGHHASYSQQPINGSPLGMWRIPAAVHGGPSFHRERSAVHPLPLFAGEEFKGSVQMGSGGPSSQAHQYGYDTKANVKDHVSLDLHL